MNTSVLPNQRWVNTHDKIVRTILQVYIKANKDKTVMIRMERESDGSTPTLSMHQFEEMIKFGSFELID